MLILKRRNEVKMGYSKMMKGEVNGIKPEKVMSCIMLYLFSLLTIFLIIVIISQ